MPHPVPVSAAQLSNFSSNLFSMWESGQFIVQCAKNITPRPDEHPAWYLPGHIILNIITILTRGLQFWIVQSIVFYKKTRNIWTFVPWLTKHFFSDLLCSLAWELMDVSLNAGLTFSPPWLGLRPTPSHSHPHQKTKSINSTFSSSSSLNTSNTALLRLSKV